MTETNLITNSIIKYIDVMGGAAFRINTSGIPIIKGGKVIGFRKSRNKGAADIRIIFAGYSIDVEIKIGKDKMNPDQVQFAERVKSAGGEYWEVRSFEEFETKFQDWREFKNLNYN